MFSIARVSGCGVAAMALTFTAAAVSAQEGTAQTTSEMGSLENASPTRNELSEQLDSVTGQLQAMTEPFEAVQSDVKKLKGLKLSGYVQARYEMNQSSKGGVSSKDGVAADTKNQFLIRRGRLKATYTGTPWSEVVLQIDATGRGVVLRDAEVSLLEPLTPFGFKFTLGQTKLPFGFEIPQSSSDREMPERSLMVRQFFPGERDRGIKVAGSFGVVRLALGLFNGNGIEDTGTKFVYREAVDTNADGEIKEGTKTSASLNFGNTDRDHWKDFGGRLGVDLGMITGGLSLYQGTWGYLPAEQVVLVEDADGVKTYEGTNDLTALAKTRLGADVQLYLGLIPALGGTGLRAEVIQGHGIYSGSTQSDKDARGWSATLVQSIGTKLAVAARVDQFDPDLDSEATEDTTMALEPALLLYPTEAVKLTLAYQIVNDFLDKNDDDTRIDKANNQLTLQLQGKF